MAHLTTSELLTLELGDDLELVATFTDTTGAAADPTTVTFRLIDPAGAATDYLDTDPEVTRTELGRFVFVFVPDSAGRWSYTVTGTGGGVDSADYGYVDVHPLPAAGTDYTRWGLTVEAATRLTGVELSAALLETAEAEIVDWLGWEPDPDDYNLDGTDRRPVAFARAVAWQAAHRAATPATAVDGGTPISQESIGGGDYAVTYARPHVEAEEVAPKARRLLTRAGWTARGREGSTSLGGPREPVPFQ